MWLNELEYDKLKKNMIKISNKYRFKLHPKIYYRTESFERLQAIKQIIESKKKGYHPTPIKFGERKILQKHREALLECAKLWSDLDEMEIEVRSRKPKSNLTK